MTRLLLLALAGALALPGAAAGGGGAEIYAAHCARCHGSEGVPLLPGAPDFSRSEGLDRSDRALIETIRHGRGAMPGFETVIDNQGMTDVLFHLRTLQR